MAPIQALELVRGFAKAIQESTPEAQREVVQRVFQWIAITDDRVTDVDVPGLQAISGGSSRRAPRHASPETARSQPWVSS